MKKIYLLLPFSVMCLSAMQVAAKDGAELMASGVVIPSNFPYFNPRVQGNTTGSDKPTFRLVAKTNTMHNGYAFVPTDSTRYSFDVAGRGGLVDLDKPTSDESVLFSESYTYYYNSHRSTYDNKLYRKQAFDAKDNITSLTYAMWKATTGAWKDSARYLYTYVAGSNKMDASLFQLAGAGGMWNPHDQSTLTYNGNYVTAINALSYAVDFSYDANNNIISIIDKVADHSTGAMSYNEKKNYTYSNGEVATYTLEKWNAASSGWEKNKYWEYTYSSNKKLQTSVEYNWNGSNWEKYARYSYSFNAAGNMEWQVTALWDATTGSFKNSVNEEWNYNDFGLLSSIKTNNWNGNTWVNESSNTETRYYYEYYAPTSVSNTPAVAGTMNLYPIPAVNNVNLDINWNKPQSFNVAIVDMYGKVVSQWTEASNSNYKKSIDVSSFPSGSYMIAVKGETDMLTQKFVVTK